jgi:hypothetical protein
VTRKSKCTHAFLSHKAHVSSTIEAMLADTAANNPAWGGVHLLDLPESVLNAIAQRTLNRHAKGHPMLAVATAARDVVLRGLTKIKLDLPSKPQQPADVSYYQPTARLLHRACRQAPAGLHVGLTLREQVDALPALLQPGLDSGGWHNVSKLEVRTMFG